MALCNRGKDEADKLVSEKQESDKENQAKDETKDVAKKELKEEHDLVYDQKLKTDMKDEKPVMKLAKRKSSGEATNTAPKKEKL